VKTFFIAFALLMVVLAIYPFLDPSENNESVTGLPWQIDLLPDGSTRVFGLQPGVSTLGDAQALLGDDNELAIVSTTGEAATEKTVTEDDAGSLEMYYGHYRAGLLSGKLVLLSQANRSKLEQWRENAAKSAYMGSGKAKKYSLSSDDLPQALAETIVAITFIPAVNLDEEVILARFGQPEQRIETDGVMHFLYPTQGLDIALHARSKEVLQYVAPTDFQRLLEPLQKP
jgi:uncharacterized protein YjeT (DUF2065 family)